MITTPDTRKTRTMALTLAIATGALALSGCATTGSVKRAQARADQAYTYADTANGAAQHAQGSADQAMGAAQHAQGSADAAGAAAQNAGASANAAGMTAQGASSQIDRLNARVHHLEYEEARHHAKARHHHHRKPHARSQKVQSEGQASFHGGN